MLIFPINYIDYNKTKRNEIYSRILPLKESIQLKKKFSLLLCLVATIGLLSGCSISTDPITAETATGLWDKVFVLPLANFITFLYNLFNNNLGLAIILATAIVRLVLIPLYLKSNQSTAIMQEIQQEMMELYNKYNFNPMMGCLLPLLPMPIFLVFYQAISRHSLIKNASSSDFFV